MATEGRHEAGVSQSRRSESLVARSSVPVERNTDQLDLGHHISSRRSTAIAHASGASQSARHCPVSENRSRRSRPPERVTGSIRVKVHVHPSNPGGAVVGSLPQRRHRPRIRSDAEHDLTAESSTGTRDLLWSGCHSSRRRVVKAGQSVVRVLRVTQPVVARRPGRPALGGGRWGCRGRASAPGWTAPGGRRARCWRSSLWGRPWRRGVGRRLRADDRSTTSGLTCGLTTWA